MTQWGFNDDGDDGQPNNNSGQGGGLRQFAEQVQQENKDLKAQLAEIQDTLRVQKLERTFDSLGVPGAAALYKGDADPEKMKTWVAEMQHVFGGAPAPQSTTPPTPQTPAMTPEQQQQFQGMNEAGQQGQPLGSMEMAQAGVGDANSVEDLIANFNKFVR